MRFDRIMLLAALVSLSACAPVLFNDPRIQVIDPPATVADPDQYKINSDVQLHFAQTAFPPTGRLRFAVRIEPSDKWQATHRIGEYRLFYSNEYQRRQCEQLAASGPYSGAARYSGRCEADYLYHLIVTTTGHPKGWMLLHNPARVPFKSDRYVDLDLSQRMIDGWPAEAVLIPVGVASASPDHCEDIAGTYKARGSLEIKGVQSPVRIVDALNRPGPNHADSFVLQTGTKIPLKFVFRDAEGKSLEELPLGDATCSNGVWERAYSYSGTADGTRVSGKRRWLFQRNGPSLQIRFSESDPRKPNDPPFVTMSTFSIR